ncbi:MAG TPA: UDP-3-O-acyl-N-acetylglucosamine deacetylase, partial [Pirellulaceae bacterium]|nr:UDP-3-O-acyl-N-acetylglucosamine deacetylase [Pirellulaceae bacterium]
MNDTRLQQTIGQRVKLQGIGYWSGQEVTLEFTPAPPGFGIVFARRDLPGIPSIPARVMYRTEVPRRSNLSRGMAAVDMVEHVLAACAGLNIDNCQIIANHAE